MFIPLQHVTIQQLHQIVRKAHLVSMTSLGTLTTFTAPFVKLALITQRDLCTDGRQGVIESNLNKNIPVSFWLNIRHLSTNIGGKTIFLCGSSWLVSRIQPHPMDFPQTATHIKSRNCDNDPDLNLPEALKPAAKSQTSLLTHST